MNKRLSLVLALGLAFAGSTGCGFGDNHASHDDSVVVGDDDPAPDAGVPSDSRPPPDTGSDSPPAAVACDLIEQTGCGATEACDLTGVVGDDSACRPVAAQGTSNDRCSTQNDCAAGWTCAPSEDDPSIKWCHRMCELNADCGSNERCVFEIDDANDDVRVDVCSNSCNPVTSGGCPTGLGCYVHEAGATDFTDCVVMGTIVDGGACTADADCQPGSACINTGATTTCHSYCAIGGNDCLAGQTCGVLSPSLSVAGVAVGVCH